MGYAMACVEVAANCSPRGRDLYEELVSVWAAPGLKALYEQFMAEVPEEEVEGWKERLKRPEIMLLPDPSGLSGRAERRTFGSSLFLAEAAHH